MDNLQITSESTNDLGNNVEIKTIPFKGFHRIKNGVGSIGKSLKNNVPKGVISMGTYLQDHSQTIQFVVAAGGAIFFFFNPSPCLAKELIEDVKKSSKSGVRAYLYSCMDYNSWKEYLSHGKYRPYVFAATAGVVVTGVVSAIVYKLYIERELAVGVVVTAQLKQKGEQLASQMIFHKNMMDICKTELIKRGTEAKTLENIGIQFAYHTRDIIKDCIVEIPVNASSEFFRNNCLIKSNEMLQITDVIVRNVNQTAFERKAPLDLLQIVKILHNSKELDRGIKYGLNREFLDLIP